jgi:methylmalonyl-CoA/ethylmalonyl-CoA epimerase
MIPELKDCHLDHVAVAVKSLKERIPFYQDLGLEFDSKREVVADQKVTTAFAALDQHAHLELLEPTDESSVIAKFINEKGEGIHHLSFRVPDIRSKMTELVAKGYRLIYPEPKIGAGGCLVNFIHPKSSGGVLIEISEAQHP